MTRDDIIRMAQEAGAIPSGDPREWDVWLFQGPAMARFAALVAAAEREACAKVCDEIERGPAMMIEERHTARQCGAAIRKRGET
jgi:hypothetical protein